MNRYILSLLMLVFFQSSALAVNNGKVELRVSGDSDSEIVILDSGLITKYFTNDVIQTQNVSLTAGAFTAFTVPSNAKGLMVDVGSVRSLALKGVTGDVGISLDSNCPVLVPLTRDASSTVGILNRNATAQTVRIYFF